MPYISISISTFNRLSLLKRLLDSLAQYNTYPKDRYKIILVDDSTNDDTLEYLKQKDTHDIYSSNKGCIPCGCGIAPYVFQIENLPVAIQYYQLGGQGDAICKNKGLQMANRETEFFLHMDDDTAIIRQGFLQRAVKIMKLWPNLGILSFHHPRTKETQHLRNNGIIQPQHKAKRIEQKEDIILWFKECSSCSTWMFRKETIDKCGYFDEDVSNEDLRKYGNLDTRYLKKMRELTKFEIATPAEEFAFHDDHGLSTY